MKIVVYGPDKRTGVLRDGQIVDIAGAYAKYLKEKKGERNPSEAAEAGAPSDLLRLIEGGGEALEHVSQGLNHVFGSVEDRAGAKGEPILFDASKTRLHAPRPRGARVACAGGNFADHAAAMAERSARLGQMQAFTGDHREFIRKGGIWGFWKVDRESTGQDGEVQYPARAKRLDYEGEIAIVLGREGKDVHAGNIKDYIWGTTLLGDWSIRMATEGGPLKFAMQKNFDGSCSIGPCICVNEGVDPLAGDVETWVNGELRQKFNTKDMVFTFGEYLEHLSKDFTFYPGDMIASGTARGTAADSSPLLPDNTPSDEKFLHAGDTVEIKNPVIGTLRTKIVAKRNR